MSQILDAVYENGTFRLLKPLDVPLQEGEQVRLVVETPESSGDALNLMLHFYDGLSEKEIKELEKVIVDRRDFFSGRPAV